MQKEEKLKVVIIKTFKEIKPLFLISLMFYILALSIGIFIGYNKDIKINLTKLPFFKIFENNILTCLKTLLFGIISFGIGTTFYVIYNGITLGYILASVYNSYGWLPILRYILPHAIFEITGFLLFSSLGYYPLKVIYVISKNSMNQERHSYMYLRGILFLIFLATVLVACAAIIESLVSYYA
ncbi:stage II sporulation protein M [Anaerocellum danielii]|uniref:Stage II sporulation protein M n=1 Tax=Anaerocellum danielii TaxID=1387557 RepID=A0ABZ0TZQ9_9FIRM|nr:stage II sporulation protein M [Caldicellulosiruptor danielii]WPX08719.1 stage II sporulation protein M [Caldicellulosiruptor danielii]